MKNNQCARLWMAAVGIVMGSTILSSVPKAMAASITGRTYTLDNHPDGAASSPFYGLRLDGLLSGKSKDVYTFNFKESGASTSLNYDDVNNTIRISGTAYGGLDRGTEYTNPELFTIDFTYRNVQKVAGDDDLWVDSRQAGNSTGTITRNSSGDVFNLVDFAGSNPYSFRLGDGDNNEGHRGHQGISGWGWLNHSPAPSTPTQHLYASDWLFTATANLPAVPESPWTSGALAVLVASFIALKHRRPQKLT
ncbi:MAG: hypothetical protein GFH24_608378n52 [Chloroflexi bacterium AL-N5]|nr:hypothetical protein [Chloroflexi bacterium AL-N5]